MGPGQTGLSQTLWGECTERDPQGWRANALKGTRKRLEANALKGLARLSQVLFLAKATTAMVKITTALARNSYTFQ